ncbi:MAG: hypothetical protein QOI00_310 [Chloroflexota bacterium]|nr:hypothetical protein [Chloroflexota bacterium]
MRSSPGRRGISVADGGTSRHRPPRARIRIAPSLAAAGLIGLLALAGAGSVVAATTVNLDQWASTDLAWQNGNLNGNNSRYPEGGIVPFRLAIEGLAVGDHAIHINYDVTAGGHKAYDFLATWNVTNAAGKACATSGGGISSMCPTLPGSSSMAFPDDPFVMDGLSVRGAEAYSAAPRRLTIWGGTLVSISAPAHSGPTSGNSSGDMLVRFHASGRAVLLAWGGHLGQSAYWNRLNGGPSDGAAMVSGSPWHMRTLQLDGTGNKNQDRSISPSAIVGALPPFALAPPTPTPRPTAPPAAPGRTPGTGGGGGGGGGGGAPGGPTGHPQITIPPTSTDALPTADRSADGGLATILATTSIGVLAVLPALRRRRRP